MSTLTTSDAGQAHPTSADHALTDRDRENGAPDQDQPDQAQNTASGPSGAPRPIEVLIVDDEPPIRLVLRATLERDQRFRVVGEASDGREAIELAGRRQPDVVLLDLLMPGLGGQDALPALLSTAPRSMVLVLSALSAVDEASSSFAAGAFAYFEKSLMGPQLADEISAQYQRFLCALKGETVWAPDAPWRIRR